MKRLRKMGVGEFDPVPAVELVRMLGSGVVKFSMPHALWEEVVRWPEIYMSQRFKSSFYDRPKRWGFTLPATVRVSDHWGFEGADGKVHCRSDREPPSGHWAVGVFDKQADLYVIVAVHPPADRDEEREYRKGRVRCLGSVARAIELGRMLKGEPVTAHAVFKDGRAVSLPLVTLGRSKLVMQDRGLRVNVWMGAELKYLSLDPERFNELVPLDLRPKC